MQPSYDDIRERIDADPDWWDENGAPRYGAFDPKNAPDVYADECVLFLVTCQECGQEFHVCVSDNAPRLAEAIEGRTLHYGDPPDGCGEECITGMTMNSEPRHVLEYWRRDVERPDREWVRDRALEIDITPSWVHL